MPDRYDVVIIGAGHGGAQAAVALRQAGFEGTIAIVGDEPDPPYERPPLSKEYLSGAKTFERILIRPAAYWMEKRIDLRLGRRVASVDPVGRVVRTEDGGRMQYGNLIWAGGGSPRRLACSGGDLRGVHAVRTRADVDRMSRELAEASRVCVVGAGYVGLEAAAVLTKSGKHVTVLEALPRVLARVAGEPLSRFYEAEHRAHGVDVHLDVTVDCIEAAGLSARCVRLSTGETIPCEMVVVGIGIVPAVAPLLAAGAAGRDGVEVDEFCRTSLPNIYAIGDCASHANGFADGARIRLESVQNATDQATVAARAIAGQARPYLAVPWFWSNQYDLRLQTVGLSIEHDAAVVRGSVADRSFSVVYLRKGRIIALDCVNATRDYVQGRRLVETSARIAPSEIADVGRELKELYGSV